MRSALSSSQGTDVLLTTQYLDEADQLASQIVIVDRGRTIADGTPAELKRRVGSSVIDVQTQRRDQLAGIAEALGRIDHGRPQIDEATRRVTVGVDGAGGGLMTALRLLDAAGLEVSDVALRQPTLDEVFLGLTGRSATEDAPNDELRLSAGRRSGRSLSKREGEIRWRPSKPSSGATGHHPGSFRAR